MLLRNGHHSAIALLYGMFQARNKVLGLIGFGIAFTLPKDDSTMARTGAKSSHIESQSQPLLQPLSILQEARKAVPALKYAVGVSGLIAVVAIIKGFGLSPLTAGLGSVGILVLMVAVFVFSRLAAFPGTRIYIPAMMLLYSFTLLVTIVAIFLVTSTFMDWPKPLSQLVSPKTVPEKLVSIAYRRTFYESFAADTISNIWLIGQRDTWSGSLQDGEYVLEHSSKEHPVLSIRTSYHEDKTDKLIEQGDCKVDVKVRIEKPGDQYSAAGLLFRSTGEGGYYAFLLTPGNNVSFARLKDGRMQFLWSQEISNQPAGVATGLRIIGKGQTIELYVNDALIHKIEQAEFLEGDPGIFAMKQGRFAFSEYAVYLPVKPKA